MITYLIHYILLIIIIHIHYYCKHETISVLYNKMIEYKITSYGKYNEIGEFTWE